MTVTTFAPPTEDDALIRPCRKHFHIAYLWPPCDDDDDGWDVMDVSGCLTWEQATNEMARRA